MEGVVTVKDTRANLDAMQIYRQNEAVKIAQALSAEGIIDSVADTAKTVVTVAGSVLTLVTKFFPGKVDDIAHAIAQPAVLSLIEASRNLLKGIFVNKDQEQICASMSDLSGNIQNITIRDTNIVETVRQRRAAKLESENRIEPERKAML